MTKGDGSKIEIVFLIKGILRILPRNKLKDLS